MATKHSLQNIFTVLGSWEKWLHHFECVAEVNKWECNTDKLKWLKVLLTCPALKVFEQFPNASHQEYREAKVLKKRFEPGRGIILKAYPNLDPDAHEQLVLTQLLASIVNPQVAFSVTDYCGCSSDNGHEDGVILLEMSGGRAYCTQLFKSKVPQQLGAVSMMVMQEDASWLLSRWKDQNQNAILFYGSINKEEIDIMVDVEQMLQS